MSLRENVLKQFPVPKPKKEDNELSAFSVTCKIPKEMKRELINITVEVKS